MINSKYPVKPVGGYEENVLLDFLFFFHCGHTWVNTFSHLKCMLVTRILTSAYSTTFVCSEPVLILTYLGIKILNLFIFMTFL